MIDTNPFHKFSYDEIPNYNFKLALLKKERYLHSPVMCKDYLQDIFWSEYTNTSGERYGLTWKPGRLDVSQPRFDLALHGGTVELFEHAPYLQEFLNHFDRALGFPESVVSTTEDRHLIVVSFGKEWTTSGPMLSALTSLIRVAAAYKGGDPREYLKSVNRQLTNSYTYQREWDPDPPYMSPEIERRKSVLPKLAALLVGKRPNCDWSLTKNMQQTHDMGVSSYNDFPKEKL